MLGRSFVVAALVAALVSSSSRARAEEPASIAVVMPALDLHLPRPTLRDAQSNGATLGAFTRAPSDIRLSRGAKTAIIVGAIVVGALLVVGVVVIAGGKKHPGP